MSDDEKLKKDLTALQTNGTLKMEFERNILEEYWSSLSFELFVLSFMQEDAYTLR